MRDIVFVKPPDILLDMPQNHFFLRLFCSVDLFYMREEIPPQTLQKKLNVRFQVLTFYADQLAGSRPKKLVFLSPYGIKLALIC